MKPCTVGRGHGRESLEKKQREWALHKQIKMGEIISGFAFGVT